MKDIEITVRCKAHEEHAKILRLRDDDGALALARILAAVLDGTSPLYVYAPGSLSPIGCCAVCHAETTAIVAEVEVSYADRRRKRGVSQSEIQPDTPARARRTRLHQSRAANSDASVAKPGND